MIAFNLTGLKKGERFFREKKSYKAHQYLNQNTCILVIKYGACCTTVVSGKRYNKTALSMDMNQELSLGGGPMRELSLHKKCFSKQTPGEIIMPPYSTEYTNLRLALQGVRDSFTTIFHAVYAATNRLHCLPFGT